MMGCIIAAAIQGPLSDSSLVQVGIFVSAGLQAICAPIFFFNWYGEKRNRTERWEDALAMEREVLQHLRLPNSPLVPGSDDDAAKVLEDAMVPSPSHESSDNCRNVRSVGSVVPFGALDDELSDSLEDNTDGAMPHRGSMQVECR